MLSIKEKMFGVHLCYGGGPAVAAEAKSAEGATTAATTPTPAGLLPWAPPEGPRALIGGGCRAGAPRALIGPLEGAPRSLIGPLEAPRSLIGWPRPLPLRPTKLPLPEEELDGCEPEAGAEPQGGPFVPSPTASDPEEAPADAAPDAAPEGDGLREETLEVVLRYLLEAAQGPKDGQAGGKGRLGGPSSPRVARAVETLRRVGDGILEKHQLAFQGMLKKLEIKNKEDLKSVSEVSKHVFSDGITNWGRIVTVISFGAFVAKYLTSINQESNIIPLAEIITDVLVTDKREWLVCHNAWEGCVKFFHVEDIESSIRNVLMAFASVAGLGAGLAYMIR